MSPFQELEVAEGCSPHASDEVPWAAVCLQPFEHFELAMVGSIGRCVSIPWTYPFCRAHFSNSKCPPSAAAGVRSFQGHCCSLSHLNISKLPVLAALQHTLSLLLFHLLLLFQLACVLMFWLLMLADPWCNTSWKLYFRAFLKGIH